MFTWFAKKQLLSGTLTVLISTLQSAHENPLRRSFNVNLKTLRNLLIKRGDRQDEGPPI